MKYPHIPVMGYQVYSGSPDKIDIPEKQILINTLNAYSYVVAEKDQAFKNALNNSGILIADGFPVVLAARILKGKKIRKIAGNDIFHHYLNLLNKYSGSCFFLGSNTETLEKIDARLKKEFPEIRGGFYSPPYKPVFNEEDNARMTSAVNNFKPDVLFVGMTAPKQEKWAFENSEKLNTKVICSIGAVFDFYASTVKRPSQFWINLKLEWFIRFVKEPRRLWKRYFIYSPGFFGYLILYLLRIRKG